MKQENKTKKEKVKTPMATSKKVAIIATIIVVLAIVTIAGIIIFQNIQRDYKVEKITSFNYYLLYKNDKMGVIDTKGNILIEPKYDSIKIPNPTKAVFICIEDYNAEDDKKAPKVLNDKNETIFTEYNQVSPIQIKDIVSDVPYEKSVLRFEQGGKYGLIDYNGKVVVKPIYDEIDNISHKEGEMIVKKDGKYGVINMKGTKLVDIQYDSIDGDNYYDEEKGYKSSGYIVGNKTDEGMRYGYISNRGRVILKPEYDSIYRVTEIKEKEGRYLIASKNGQCAIIKDDKNITDYMYQEIEYNDVSNLFVVEKGTSYGVINKEGKQVLPTDYDAISFEGVYIQATKGEEKTLYNAAGEKQDSAKYQTMLPTDNENYYITIHNEVDYGVADKDGNVIIPNEYMYIEYAFDNYFIVCNKDLKLGIMDDKGKVIIELKYDVAQKIPNTHIIEMQIQETNTTDLYSRELKQVASITDATIVPSEKYIKVFSKDGTKYFETEGKEISNIDVYTNNKVYSKELDGKWGFVDKDGNVKINYVYDRVTEFNQYGFAGIQKDGKWGVINSDGQIIIEPTYIIQSTEEPDFIGKYYRVYYGDVFYTDEIKEQEQVPIDVIDDVGNEQMPEDTAE